MNTYFEPRNAFMSSHVYPLLSLPGAPNEVAWSCRLLRCPTSIEILLPLMICSLFARKLHLKQEPMRPYNFVSECI